ncbi:MAG: hypothetical protein ACAH21_17510 [Ramlibacter sp.]
MRTAHSQTQRVTLTTTPGVLTRVAGTLARTAAALRALRGRWSERRRPADTHLAIHQLDAATLRDLGLDFCAAATVKWQ